jgi:hypothetical protein
VEWGKIGKEKERDREEQKHIFARQIFFASTRKG